MDPLILARLQFAANISFHILFPSISIALAWLLLFFKWRFGRTRDTRWMDAYRLWVKIFALTFALGVVSGVTMSFQFGTNWPGYMETVGNVAGPLLAYEVLTAFFLEATFLAIMLFGIGKVSERMHTLATVLVAAGTSLSAFWILVLNSWMQTPAGFTMIDGRAHATDWLAILFNPSMPWRMTHMLLASGLTVAFLTSGVSAWRLLRGDTRPDVRSTLRTGIVVAAVLIPLQIMVGDFHGLNTLHHQPAKIAAMEGVWKTERGAPLLLFAWPDETERRNRFELGIPRGASLILRHEADGEIQGLDDFPNAHPPVKPVFFGFRVMVGVGLLMLAASWSGVWLMRGKREPPRFWLRGIVAMTFAGWIATLAGWYVTEIGRQPWLVYGVLRTADAATKTPIPIGTSLTLYLLLYAALIVAYISVVFYLARSAVHRTAILRRGFPPTREAAHMPDLATPAGWLPVVFMALMGVALLLYVVLDGYDLGVGILLPGGTDEEKDLMVSSIGPFWDANETWLVLGIGLLLVAFPQAHGVILSSLYLPVVLMLVGLTLRGVAFDFRVKGQAAHKPLWNRLFWAGSLLTAVSQGYMLGSYITGFDSSAAARGFAVLTAACVPAAYALLGAGWLLIKTAGELQRKAVRWARRAWWGALGGFVAVSVASPLVSERIFEKWFKFPYVVLLAPLPIVTLGLLLITARSLRRLPSRLDQRNEYGAWIPFACTIGVIVIGFYGLAYSLFPYLVVDRITIWDAASAPESLFVILAGAAVVLPAILGYTIFVYRVFRGKVEPLSYG